MKSQILNLKSQNYYKGQAIIVSVLFFLIISLIVTAGSVVSSSKEVKISGDLILSKKSYFLAEAGIEDIIYRVKNNRQFSLEEVIGLNGGWATTTVTDILGGSKEIVSIADVSKSNRKIKIEITTGTGIDFFYGAQVGEGGLDMEQNSRIEGFGGSSGNVYSNGPITGENGATITGEAIVATSVTEDVQARSTICSNPPDGDQIVGQSNPEIDFAQSFQPSDSKPLGKISIYIKKVGNPGDRDVYIVPDNADSPDTDEIGGGTLYSSLVGTDYSWIDITLDNVPILTSGQTYWIVLDARRDSNDYWVWCKDKNQGYGNGVAKYSQDWDDDPWIIIIGDLTFKTYLGSGIGIIDNVDVLGDAKANTIKDSSVGNDAYYQTIINTTVGGTSYPDSSDPPIVGMPISQANIDQWKLDAEAGGTVIGDCGDSGDPQCIIGDDDTLSLGPKKIIGNLFLTKKQTLNVTGTLYFTGYLDIDSAGGAILKCDPAYGTNSCIIITDSWMHVKNNVVFQGSGESGSYLMVLTTLAGCNGGTQQAECTHHNGAMDFHNNATGAIFYSPYSMIHLHNGVNITEIVAYKLELDNTAVITYEQGLINSSFSSGPMGGWSINQWQEIE